MPGWDMVPRLVRSDDETVCGDGGYTGMEKREKIKKRPASVKNYLSSYKAKTLPLETTPIGVRLGQAYRISDRANKKQGRVRVSDREAPVWLPKGALPRHFEKQSPRIYPVHLRQSVHAGAVRALRGLLMRPIWRFCANGG